MGDESISRDERRKLKLQMKREAKERMRQDFHEESGREKIMLYAGIALAVIVVAGIFLALPKPEPAEYNAAGISFPTGQVHWHATPKIYMCGESTPIPTPYAGQHLGSGLLHTHEDALVHVEGAVSSPSQITIGAFMANIGMKFSGTELLDKKNGDLCPGGAAGRVRLVVNHNENQELQNYVMRDGDLIEMRFE